MLTLTLVIPVFNEEHQIKGCLDAVACQTVMPDEVIVVDNNCTDRTIEIAQKYPFVRVITEKNQGRGHARNAGFNAAKSEIIGRIDADSRIEPDWVEQVKKRFEQDIELAGLTGLGITSFIPGIQSIKTTLFSRSYYWFVHAGFRTITMWGSTLAVRRSAWAGVADKVCNDDSLVHEDQDLSLWIAGAGGKIEQDNSLKISTSGQSFRYLPKVLSYRKLYSNTRQMHFDNGNLISPKLHRIAFRKLFLGWIWSLLLGILLFVIMVVMFPVDYVIARKLRHNEWIE